MAKLPPGFRFSPTDIELIMYYLKRKIMGKKLLFEAISELNIYKFSPWDLPDKYCYKSKDLEWYFFCPRERKYGSGARMNRATESGYWKATGKDRPVLYNEKIVGYVKTLVFHQGHAPRGQRTDWVLHEYRFEDKNLANAGISLDAYVLCKVFQKSGPGPKNRAQYGAPFKEEEWEVDDAPAEHNSSSFPSLSVLPDNRSCSIVTSMVDPGSVSHCPSNEPSAEPNLCVVSALPALPDNTSCSLFTTMIDPGNKSVRLVTESGPSSANPCSQGMSPDDIIHLLDIFTEDPAIFSAGNKNNLSLNNVERGSNVEAASFIDGNDMYSGLEDLDDYAKLDQIPFDASLTQGADYSHNPIFLQDVPFLELNDLDIPLGHPAETVEMEPVMMGNFCTHDSDVYMQQFCFGVNSSANSQQIAGQNQHHVLPEHYIQQLVQSDSVNCIVTNVNQGYNAARAFDFSSNKQPEDNRYAAAQNQEKGELQRKFFSSLFCSGFSKHVKAEVILWIDGCTNDALSTVLGDSSSVGIPQTIVDMADDKVFDCCYDFTTALRFVAPFHLWLTLAIQ